MDIQAELNWIHQEIDKVQDPSFVEKLKHLLENFNKEKKESIVEYNNDIEQSLLEINKGEFVSEDEARYKAKKWGK